MDNPSVFKDLSSHIRYTGEFNSSNVKSSKNKVQHNTNYGYSWEPRLPEPEPDYDVIDAVQLNTSCASVFARFAEKTSMQGVPNVFNTKLVYAKILWTILLILAITAMCLHLYYLIAQYIEWPKQTKVSLSFDNLKFPAVTICNMNIVRKNKLSMASTELQNLVAITDPERFGPPPPPGGTGGQPTGGTGGQPTGGTGGQTTGGTGGQTTGGTGGQPTGGTGGQPTGGTGGQPTGGTGGQPTGGTGGQPTGGTGGQTTGGTGGQPTGGTGGQPTGGTGGQPTGGTGGQPTGGTGGQPTGGTGGQPTGGTGGQPTGGTGGQTTGGTGGQPTGGTGGQTTGGTGGQTTGGTGGQPTGGTGGQTTGGTGGQPTGGTGGQTTGGPGGQTTGGTGGQTTGGNGSRPTGGTGGQPSGGTGGQTTGGNGSRPTGGTIGQTTGGTGGQTTGGTGGQTTGGTGGQTTGGTGGQPTGGTGGQTTGGTGGQPPLPQIKHSNIERKPPGKKYTDNSRPPPPGTMNSPRDAVALVNLAFKRLYMEHTRRERSQMGHSIGDMLVSCSFAGQKCYASNFTLFQTEDYGNCWTLKSDEFIATSAGYIEGLDIILFMENEDYLKGITSGYGARVTIHEPDTLPFPLKDGFLVSTGFETHVAIKKTEVTRLGGKFGNCNSVNDFEEKYGYKFTRQLCLALCLQDTMLEKCGCHTSSTEEYRVQLSYNHTRMCKTNKERECEAGVLADEQYKSIQCDCSNPCSESKYSRVISLRNWPTDEYANVLVYDMCESHPGVCDHLQQAQDKPRSFSMEFLKLTIYYEDLNYEQIQETPEIEDAQFASDIGGAIGLWVGLAVLSTFELLQLLLELCVVLKRKFSW